MSNLVEVLTKVDGAGGTVVRQDGQVRVRVSPGTLSDQDRQVLADHRQDLLGMFPEPDQDLRDQEHDHQRQDLDAWLRDCTIEPVVCGKCGSVEVWQDVLSGGWHCAKCDPPTRTKRVQAQAERIRKRNYSRRVRP